MSPLRKIMNDSIEFLQNRYASPAKTSRRALLRGAVLTAGLAHAQEKSAFTASKGPTGSGTQPVADTVSGRVRGLP
jgi:hypothetical protein